MLVQVGHHLSLKFVEGLPLNIFQAVIKEPAMLEREV